MLRLHVEGCRAAVILTLTLTLLGVAWAANPQPPTRVFDIEIGSRFSLPHCAGKLDETLYAFTKFICWYVFDPYKTDGYGRQGHHPNGEVSVVYPFKQAPVIARRPTLTVTVLEGRVMGVSFVTNGFSDTDRVVSALTDKFGTPNKNTSTPLENALGAHFRRVECSWVRPDVTVTYDNHPWPEDLKEGRVTVYTPAAARFREEQLKANHHPTPL